MRLPLPAEVTAAVESHSAVPETQLTPGISTTCNEIDPETGVVSDGIDSEDSNGSGCGRGGLLLPQAQAESEPQLPMQSAGNGGSGVTRAGGECDRKAILFLHY